MNRATLATSMCIVLAGCSTPERSNQRHVSKQEMGAQWPLTVEAGVLSCEAEAVTFESNGIVYALNGPASMRKLGRRIDDIWRPREPEWITDPKTKQRVNVAPPKVDIGPLLHAGLALCPK